MRNIVDVVARLRDRLAPRRNTLNEAWASFTRLSKARVSNSRSTELVAYPETGTYYQQELDRGRLARLLPYRTSDKGLPLDKVEKAVNSNFYLQYGPDYRRKTAADISVDSPLDYERLLKSIKHHPNIRFKTLRDAIKIKPAGGEIVAVVRHDLDGDLVAARQQAEIENRLGIQTTYYLLHTAPYYGTLRNRLFTRNKLFVRNVSSMRRYLEIQALGHELALHTDGMTLYHDHGIDGAAAIVEELAWLRSGGCNVTGSTAHNSFGVYGCSNYSIFEGRPIRMYDSGAHGVVHNGRWAPLQVLSEKQLGLDYEAVDFVFQKETPVFYAALRSQNCWRTEIRNVAGNPAVPEPLQNRLAQFADRIVSQDDVLDVLPDLVGPMWIYLVIHPMHFGQRPDQSAIPWKPVGPVDTEKDGTRLWADAAYDGSLERCAITRLNEFGTPDRGLDCYKSGSFRLAVFGDGNVSTHKVPVDAKVAQVTARFLHFQHKRPGSAAISIGRERWLSPDFHATLRRIDAVSPPDVIVLGIRQSDPDLDEILRVADASRRDGRRIVFLVEGGLSLAQAPSADFVGAIEAEHGFAVADPYAMFAAYTGRASLARADGSGWTPQAHKIAAELLAATIANLP